MYACKWLGAITLCLTATLAQGAGIRAIDIPASADGPALKGAVWYLCSQPPEKVDLGKITLPGVKDCPLPDKNLPLIVVSHGRRGNFIGHYDTYEVLADAGFVVAAVNHPGDNVLDLSRTDDLSIYVERPNHIKRLVDFMVGASPLASNIDRERIGIFGFSRGGYTGLAVIGANPDWASATDLCRSAATACCLIPPISWIKACPQSTNIASFQTPGTSRSWRPVRPRWRRKSRRYASMPTASTALPSTGNSTRMCSYSFGHT